jgi:hypothetical protein
MRHRIRDGAIMAILLMASAVIAFGQASGSLAELRGQVTDATGAAIPGAKVTLVDITKGATRTAVTDAEGSYLFLGLAPARYDLKVEAQGFAEGTARLELTVGQQANIPFALGAGKVEVKVDIVAGAEVVETQRTEQSSVVDGRQIVNLPINRRSFLDYALLTPGVSDADNIADASDFRVAQTPQSGLSFGGSNGRGNMVSVDGAESIAASGGVQATISQEGVQEFQVLRSSFSAEFGGASGGIVNIVSKSGGNQYHGSVFGLFRNQRFDARNAFDFNPEGKSPFSRQQFGGSVGGPIRKDKSFFFFVIERLNQERTSFVNLLKDPTIFQVNAGSNNASVRQQAALFDFIATSAFAPEQLKAGAMQLRGALTTTNYPRTVGLFNSSSGQFPFDEGQTQISARLDQNFSDRSAGYLRFNFTDALFENQATGALTAASRGRKYDSFNGGVIASHNYQLSSTTLNELKLQFSHTRTAFLPNDPNGPEINIEGFGNFGRDIFLPSQNIEKHFDIYDNLSKVIGTHSLKFGGSIFFQGLNADNQTFFGGRFSFGQAIPMANLLGATPAAQVANPINQFVLAAPGSTFRDGNGNGLADVFESPITALQAYNLGLPTVFQGGFGDPIAKGWTNRYAFYAQDTWRLRQNLTLNYGLRYSISDEPFLIPTSKKDWQPRVGFSWDPWKDGKTVIRGGAGIFTGFLNNAVANVTSELSNNGDPSNINIVLTTATAGSLGLPSSFAVYQTLLAGGVLGTRPISRADVVALGLTPRPDGALEVRFRLGPNYRSPTTYQSSLGVQRDLGGGISLEATYLFTRGLHLSRNRDINQTKVTGLANPLNPLGGATFIRFPNAADAAAGRTTDFARNIRFQDNVYEMTANSFYHGFTLQAQKRFARSFSLNAHYTLSKSIDEVTDYNSDFSAQNPLNIGLDRSLSSFDQRHRFVANAVIQSWFENPYAKNWVFSPIFIAGSGRPFNLLLGFDANNDGRSQSDRPGLAGRNTGTGEALYSFDMRIGRRFLAKEDRFLELTFEAFNLFNRTNMQGINNTLGAACVAADGSTFAPCTSGGAAPLTNFNLRGRRDQQPTQPLGFTSAADSRQLQFGLRFNF